MSIKIRNMRRRMVRLPLGNMQRKTSVVHVTKPARGRGRAGSMAVTDGGRGRRRIAVSQQLIIPAGAAIDRLPDGSQIPADIQAVPSIAAAVERGDIRIEG